MTTATPPVAPTTETGASAARPAGDAFRLVAFDLYRDIHKGIRAELFSVTAGAGSLDPGDRLGRAALADHVASVISFLESHAAHEDAHVEPALRQHLPDLADRVAADHAALEAHLAWIGAVARDAVDAPTADQRRLTHLVHLELSGFTSAYLAHQLVEEREIMPALEDAIGIDAVVAIHVAIISSIPPAEMAQSLALMFPAMNLDDRTELLEGMRMTAPPEAFSGVVGIARSVLEPADFTALGARLKIG
jgi:hypothetical protein